MFTVNLFSYTHSSMNLGASVTGLAYVGPGSQKPSEDKPGTLIVPQHDLQENASIFDLLSWHTRISTFRGRDDEMQELETWAESSPAVSVKFITGEGGEGKSRLAGEFALMMKEKKWNAGFIDLHSPNSFSLHKKGTLLIVDYPEEKQEAATELLHNLTTLGAENRIRVLFLSRWMMNEWDEMIAKSKSRTIINKRSLILTPINTPENAYELFSSIQEKAAEVFKTTSLPLSQSGFQEWLALATENRKALFIVSMGVYNALNPNDEKVDYKAPEIIEALVERELERLIGITEGFQLERYSLASLYAVAAIAGEQTIDDIQKNDDKVLTACGLPDNNAFKKLLQDINLFPDGKIIPPSPDIVAALFTAKVFDKVHKTAPNLLRFILDLDINSGLSRLGRVSYDVEYTLGFHRFSLSSYLGDILENSLELCKLTETFFTRSKLPQSFSHVRIKLWSTLLDNERDDKRKADLLIYHSLSLSSHGKRGEALHDAKKAVEIYEKLVLSNIKGFESYLAMSLNNLGKMYSDLGMNKEALEASEKAVEIFKNIVRAYPGISEFPLAMSLNNLGKMYSELGRKEKALGTVKNAVEIYECIVQSNPNDFQSDFAMCLNNLGVFNAELGNKKEALNASKKAVEIYERLANSNPEVFDADFAMGLHNLGTQYSALGKNEKALETTKQAVDIRGKLAEANPEAFEPSHAMSLNNLGHRYLDLENKEKALEASIKAVKIYEKLAQSNPNTFEAILAKSCGTIGTIYLQEFPKEAMGSFKRGITILQRLFFIDPQAYVGLMPNLLLGYLNSSEASKSEPDDELIIPIINELKKLDSPS